MKIEEIKKIEGQRNEAKDWNMVHFLKEPNGFYRAHGWSAWLLKRFPFNDLIASMNVTAKKVGDNYIDAFVGFPATSLKKYIPDAEQMGFTVIDDNHFTIVVEITPEVGDVSFLNLNGLVEEWLHGLELTEKKPRQRQDREVAAALPQMFRLSDMANEIMAFPLEEKSLMETFEFVRRLRRQLAERY